MKKILYALAIGICFSACESEMEKYPLDAISPNTFFNTESDLRLYTNSFYLILPSAEGVYNESVDNVIKTSLEDEIRGVRIVPTSGGGWDWTQLRNINFYLMNSQKCQDTNARARYDGVARFFRAYFYFDKVKRFGDVPWYEEVISDQDIAQLQKARDPRTLVVGNILNDIDYAIDNLPTVKSLNEVTRWTALALKARICLHEGTFRKYHTEFNLPDWETFLDEAIRASGELITQSGYSLYNTSNPESDYMNLFASLDAIPAEVILSRGFSDEFQVYHNLNYYTMTASYGRPGLEKRLVNSYLMRDGKRFTDRPGYETMLFVEETKNRDPRLSQTIRTPGYTRIGNTVKLVPEFGSTVTGYQLIKFVSTEKYDTYEKSITDMPIFRFAEALLIYAEAKAERGTLTQEDIDKSIKVVRDRVGMPNLNLAEANANPDPYLEKQYPHVGGTNKGVILEIRRERRIELVMESFRWDDMMRWKEGATFTEQFKGMYFPGLGNYDLDGDEEIDVCLYDGDRPVIEGRAVQYLKLNGDVTLENGQSGCIVVNPHINKVWDEEKDYLHPIPIQERLLNPNLTQNKGWNDGL
ncbi:MAG: RagB/SusD family nutrient uptake outer membrane protein [Tannerellaceae bacterium]|nr:RagB/SusD family nutrient uptake outer membrane protein [Tannerellaceae bacterium]